MGGTTNILSLQRMYEQLLHDVLADIHFQKQPKAPPRFDRGDDLWVRSLGQLPAPVYIFCRVHCVPVQKRYNAKAMLP